MAELSYGDVYRLAREAGLSRAQAITATAVAAAESQFDYRAQGDLTLVDEKWGPSLGLWQVRSLNAERGKGTSRDANRLTDPKFNARAMAEVSGKGTNWKPWTMFRNGRYRDYLDEATAAADGKKDQTFFGGSIAQPSPKPRDRANASGVSDGGFGPDWLYDDGPSAIDKGLGAVGDAANPLPELVDAAQRALPYVAAVMLGMMLISIGAWRAVQ